jgi:hypothetical protein
MICDNESELLLKNQRRDEVGLLVESRSLISFEQLEHGSTKADRLADKEHGAVERFDDLVPSSVLQKVLTCFDPSHAALLKGESLDHFGVEGLLLVAERSMLKVASGDTEDPLDKVMAELVGPSEPNSSENQASSDRIFETFGMALHPFVVATDIHMTWSQSFDSASLAKTGAKILRRASFSHSLRHSPSPRGTDPGDHVKIVKSGLQEGDKGVEPRPREDLQPDLVVTWNYPYSPIDDAALAGFQLFTREKTGKGGGPMNPWRVYSNETESLKEEGVDCTKVVRKCIIDKRSREARISGLKHSSTHGQYEVALFAVWQLQDKPGDGDDADPVMPPGRGSESGGMAMARYGRVSDVIEGKISFDTLLQTHSSATQGISFAKFYTLLMYMSAQLYEKTDVDNDGMVSVAEVEYIFSEVLCADSLILQSITEQMPKPEHGGPDLAMSPVLFGIFVSAHLNSCMGSYYQMFHQHTSRFAACGGVPGLCKQLKRNIFFSSFVNLVIVCAAFNDALSTYPHLADVSDQVELVLLGIFTTEIFVGVAAHNFNLLQFVLGTELSVRDFLKLKWSEIAHHLRKHGHKGGEVDVDEMYAEQDGEMQEASAKNYAREKGLNNADKRRVQLLPLFRGEGYAGAWNSLDLFIVVTGWISVLTSRKGANFLRTFRLLRLVRLCKSHKLMQSMMWGCMVGLKSSFTIIIVFMVLLILSAVLCVNFFAKRDPFHFFDVRTGILALYTMTTMDWVWVLDTTSGSCKGQDHYRSPQQFYADVVQRAIIFLGEKAKWDQGGLNASTTVLDRNFTEPIFKVAQQMTALELSSVCIEERDPPLEVVVLAVSVFYGFTIAISMITMTLFVGSVSISILKVMQVPSCHPPHSSLTHCATPY